MNATQKQIDRARQSYNNMMVIKDIQDFNPEYIGISEAEARCQFHNNIVTSILNGDKELEKKWKLFFLNQVIGADNKADAKKSKLADNKSASSDNLAIIKAAGKKLGDYYKWLNNRENKFRNEYFTKKYTSTSVNAFLAL